MPNYTIEMLWTCSGCGETSNRGLARRCHGCGKPKGPEDAERFPDWKCAYCGTFQPRLGRCCTNCGVDQASGVEPWKHAPQHVTADASGTTQAPAPMKRPAHQAGHTPSRMRERESTASDLPPSQLRTFPWQKTGIAVGVTLFGLLAGWWLFAPRIVEAEVVAVRWEHRVLIDRWQLNPEDGWTPPAGAVDVRQDGARIHHYDHVRVGSHTESYPEQYACGQDCRTVPGSCSTSPVRCSSNGNGTASCSGGDTSCSPPSQSCSTRYCTRTATRTVDDYEDQPRYAPWYVWKEWGWKHNRTLKKAGSDFETFWPSDAELTPVSLGPGERERQTRQAKYTTTFRDTEGERHDIHPAGLARFQALPLGMKANLKIRRVGTVELLDATSEAQAR